MAETTGIRARAREALRGELAETALSLFEQDGFEQTTVEDIAVAAGISARTFYRYFGAKEEVLFSDIPAVATTMRARLTENIAQHEPWMALRLTVRVIAVEMQEAGHHWARVARIIGTTEALRARNFERHMQLAQAMIPVVSAHLDDERVSLSMHRASVLVHAALLCFDLTSGFWSENEGQDLVEALDAAFDSFGVADSSS